MFENIVGLDDTCLTIADAITSDKFPPAVLLSGPQFGAKTTIALEIARSLTCSDERTWDCDCPSCRRQRTLQHESTVLIGRRPFQLDISASLDALRRQPRRGTRFLVIRAVRRLTRRFDPFLWDERRIKDVAAPVTALEESLEELEQLDSPPDDLLSAIEKNVTRLNAALPHEMIPVSLVRALSSWAHTTGSIGRRIVVIEEAQSMGEAARNAMLKTLEEPPDGLYFVLTSSRRSAIIPTILSRVRSYEVPQRSIDRQNEVLRRVFRFDTPRSLREHFHSFRGELDERYETLARLFLQEETPTEIIRRELKDTVAKGDVRQNSQYLLEMIGEMARGRLASAPSEQIERFDLLRAQLDEAWDRIERRNLNPLTTLQALAPVLRSGRPA